MSKLVRVARDESAIIVKTDDGEYVRASLADTSDRASASLISGLTADGSWRRATKQDEERLSLAVVISAGKVYVEEPDVNRARLYRVPPSVQRSITEALQQYSSILGDQDREVALRLATRTHVSREDVEWMGRFFDNIEKALSLHGGRRGQSWAKKALSAAEESESDAVTAGGYHTAFDVDDPHTLFICGGDDEDAWADEDELARPFDTLYMVEVGSDAQDVYVWEGDDFAPLELPADEIERDRLVEVDPETARAFAEALDSAKNTPLGDLFPEERNLFSLAESEIDWNFIDQLAVTADATGYSPAERSQNAQRQPRTQGGKFGGGSPVPVGKTLSKAFAKARLPQELPIIEDPAAHIDAYIADVTGGEVAPAVDDEAPIVAATEPGAGASPLYLAVVDAVDKTAVLDVLSIVPDDSGQPTGWRREGGEWVNDPNIVADLKGDTPPALVELNEEQLIKDVLAQVDASDGQELESDESKVESVAASAYELANLNTDEREKLAKKGYALPDGSFPIRNEADLKKAVQAYGRAGDKEAARRHIKKRARALNRADLIPEDWKSLSTAEVSLPEPFGPFGEVIIASGVPGIADTPEDFKNVARLKRYWAFGKGTAKWRPGTPGDWTRLRRALTKYVGPHRSAGLATNIYQMRFGMSNAEHDKKFGA